MHKTTHTGEKPFKCNLCFDRFINRHALDRHMRVHGVKFKMVRCEHCFKELSNQTVLTNHIRRHHIGNAICEICKTEMPKGTMKQHLQQFHEPIPCKYCSKTFRLPRYLKRHELLHDRNNSNRDDCPYCPKNYSVKGLKTHIFKAHPDKFQSWIAG